MFKKEGETFKEYAQRWRDLAAQVAPPMVEREMITMMVDTLPVFYYEKLVGYMPSSFADLVFVGERIEVGLKRGKFDYVSSTSANAKRVGTTGAKRKREMPTPSLRRPRGLNPRRHLMVRISTLSIIRASRLTPGIPLIQHPCSLRHPFRGRPPKFQLQPRLARPTIPTQ